MSKETTKNNSPRKSKGQLYKRVIRNRKTNNADTQPESLLTRQQVADRLGVCYHTILALEEKGQLNSIRLGNRFIRFRPSDVADLIRKSSTISEA